MANLQDVRQFVRKQDNLTTEELEAKVAHEFDMTRDEAAQMLRGLSSEDPMFEPASPSLLNTTAVAVGLTGTSPGGTQNAAGAAALLVTEAEKSPDATPDQPERHDD
jgi:hypothetical protein